MTGTAFLRFFGNPAVALLCLLLVASLRFNRNDFIVSRPLDDAAFYIANVEKIRGIEPATYPYKGPFNERVLGTTIAAFLPFPPLTAINITNLLFLAAAAYFLFRLLRDTGIPEGLSWLGLYLFIFSFPTFYYSTIGYTDPTVLTCIFCSLWALYTGRHVLFLIAVVLGALSKENIVIMIPVAFMYAILTKDTKTAMIAGLALLLVLATGAIIRNITSGLSSSPIWWKPDLSRGRFNMSRPNFYISTIFSWGIPLLICVCYLLRYPVAIVRNFKTDLPLYTGIACILGTTVYMITAAFPDGRNVWVAYCFPVFLAMRWWHRFGNPFAGLGKKS